MRHSPRAPAPLALRVPLLLLPLLAVALPADAGEFRLVATHPDAAAESTVLGTTLRTLKPFNGKLYAGYGDYGPMNTGPITIRAFDPAVGRFTDSLLSRPQPPHGAETNAVLMFREIGGKLYAPHIDRWPDPPPPGQMGGYSLGVPGAAGDTWTDHSVVASSHLFDMATFDGTDLWIVGSRGTDAVAWRKRNDASGWEESLVVGPEADADFARFYAVHAYKGKLYVQGHDHGPDASNLGPQSASWVFDGNAWSPGPSLAGGYIGALGNPQTFAGYMVFKRNHGGLSGRISKFDGTTTTLAYPDPAPAFYDYTIDDGVLYALITDGRIMRTTDLATWSLHDTAPADARSLGVLGDDLYVGAQGGRLYQYVVPEPATLPLLGPLCLLFSRRITRRPHREA